MEDNLSGQILSAKEYLQRLRKGGDCDYNYEKMKIALGKEKKSLRDIGVTVEELDELFKKEKRESAKNRLVLLQDGRYNYDYYVEKLWEDLNGCGLTLSDIGTDKTKLEQLFGVWIRASANSRVEVIRKGGNCDYQLGLIRNDLGRIGLTLESFGIREEQLRQMQIAGQQQRINEILAAIRASPCNRERNIAQLHHELNLADKTMADFQTSEDELNILLREGRKG